ncbi:mev-1, partial [Pristionchus pacificus]
RIASRQIVSRSLCTSVRRTEELKTPIQKLGWEYLMKQKSLGRPISPHLQIYAPQWTWYVSGLHRITGCVMGGALLVGGVGFAVLPLDFTTFIDFIRGLNLPTAVTALFKWIIAFPIIFHSVNGVRFLGFDLAKGTDLATVYKGAYFVIGFSVLLATLVVIRAQCNK